MNNTNMNTETIIKVFIGSPSDTKPEREEIAGIVEELNHTIGASDSISIKSIMWENDVTPTIGTDGQDVINTQTRDYDIFVGMMWKKYGYPTPRANSATDEEYSYAYETYKKGGHCKDIIMMFSKVAFTIDDVDTNQLEKVKQFKKRVEKDGVYHKDYKDIDEFTKILRVALYNSIKKIIKSKEKEPAKSKTKNKDYRPKTIQSQTIDENTKLVFDTLSISPAVNSIKTNFIESYILLYLYDQDAYQEDIIEYLNGKLGAGNTSIYKSIFQKLSETDAINNGKPDKKYTLSNKKREEITSIKEKAEKSAESLISECNSICKKYDLSINIDDIHSYICNLYSSNFATDTSELSRGSINRETSIKKIFEDLVKYIQSESELPYSFAQPIAQDLIGAYSRNPIFYKANISKMFLGLFQNERLEEYLSSTNRELILDTQVLLQLCCVTFDDIEPIRPGVLYRIGKRFWESIKSNKTIDLFSTTGYVSEVVDHLKQAINLSRFLSLDYIIELGSSKNVFFNHYLSIKDDRGYDRFEQYISDLLDIDYDEIYDKNFSDIAYRQLSSILESFPMKILKHEEVENYTSYKREYEKELSYSGISRSYDAINNDINAAIIAGNYFKDFYGTPYLITNDSLFSKVRDILVDKFSDSFLYWYVYTPQKITEILSLIQFKVDPIAVDESIISLAEASFNTSNDSISFLDLLNTFIDSKDLSDWKLASKLAKLRKLCKDDSKQISIQANNLPIDEILSSIIKEVSRKKNYSFNDLKEIFCDNNYAEEISDIIKDELKYYKTGGKVRDVTVDACVSIIDKRKNTI